MRSSRDSLDQSPNYEPLNPEVYKDIVWHSPVGIFTSTPAGRFTFANPAMARIYGYPSPAAMIDSITDISTQVYVNSAEREQFQRKIRELGELINHEYLHLRRDGSMFWVSLNARAIYDQHGNLTHYHGFSTDITERKNAASFIESRERYLQKILETSEEGFWVVNATGLLQEVNQTYCAMSGYSHEELLGLAIADLEALETPGETAARINRIKTNGAEIFESLHRRKDGTIYPVEISVTWLDQDGGQMVCFCRDITARKLADEALRKSEERFSLAMKASKDGIWDWDLTTGYIYCSPALTSMLGYDSTDVIEHADQWQDLIYPEDRQRAYQANLDCVNNLTDSFEIEYRLKTSNGGWKWILGRGEAVYRDASGKALRVIGTHLDITERKQAEELLTRQQRSLMLSSRIANVFLTSSRDEIFADVLDVILKALDSRFGYFGYIDETGDLICPSMTRDAWEQCQIPGKSVVFPRSCWGGLWGESLLEKQTVIANENLQLPEGHVTLENALAVPIVYADNLIGQFVLANKVGGYDKHDRELLESTAAQTAPILFAMQEEARRKTLHEKLEEQLRQAQKMESVGRLAGGVAHDFNNMLGVILGHTEMALDETDPETPVHASLQVVEQAAKRSAALTRQLLTFARKQTVAPKVIDLNDTVEGMLNMLRRLIGEDIDLFLKPGSGLQPVKVDPSQIDQLLANLCVNARDAIAGVGKITIETASATFDEAYCAEHLGSVPGEYVLLAVSDDGCGMDQETLGHIFEPFFTTKEQGKGTGLGLASVFGMVKQNKGFINVYSEPNQGTTFKIYLPRHEKSAKGQEQATILPAERGQETILLVEDEPAILEMTTMMLTRLGYTVLPANTPREAIRLADEYQGRIDLLMTDVVMPDMNGRDLAANLLAHYPDLKRLFMSGYTANVIAHHGVLDEGVHFIQKPFSMKDLGGKLRKALEG
jgi:PAS domain S-box-containing protein